MPEKILYQQQLLRAVNAFIEGRTSSILKARRIIDRCSEQLESEERDATLNEIVWGSFIRRLKDSVYYENSEYLHDTLSWLSGSLSAKSVKVVFHEDYRDSFAELEKEWYNQLLQMVEFLTTIPSIKIYNATVHAQRSKMSWETMQQQIPEAAQAASLDEEYARQKGKIEETIKKISLHSNRDEEKIYQVVLRNVTDMILDMYVGKAVAYFGRPIFDGTYSVYGSMSSEWVNATESIVWASRLLETLAGKRDLFLLARLGKGGKSAPDVLLLFLQTF